MARVTTANAERLFPELSTWNQILKQQTYSHSLCMNEENHMSHLHRFSRTELLIGPDGVSRLKESTVAVFGLGGVGGFAAEALCRAGIGRLVIVDFDDICLTNVNRQIHAMDGTVGKAKVQVMAERMRLINPAAEIIPFKDFYAAENSDFLLAHGYDYVVDAIDHFTSKLHLIRSCRERDIPIISSMGAAAKLDPTKIQVADISETHRCRMARSVRKLLKKQGIDRRRYGCFLHRGIPGAAGQGRGMQRGLHLPEQG